jgi:hypothetical protein
VAEEQEKVKSKGSRVKATSVNRKKAVLAYIIVRTGSDPPGKSDITRLALCGFLKNEIQDDGQNPQF